jgi:hypothetical protein
MIVSKLTSPIAKEALPRQLRNDCLDPASKNSFLDVNTFLHWNKKSVSKVLTHSQFALGIRRAIIVEEL